MKRVNKQSAAARPAGRWTLLAGSGAAVFLGAVLACLCVVLAYRLDVSWEASVGTMRLVSARTRDVLASTQGSVKVACFMDRRHPMFRPVSRLLRGLREASRGVAGAEIAIEYVDPRWDLTRAAQLAAWGVPENALLFERQRRRIVVTLDEMLAKQTQLRLQEGPGGRGGESGLGVFRGEMVCASAIARLSLPYERSVVYWLQGHGESRPDDYDELRGFSDIARAMKRDGYDVRPLTLPGKAAVPADCHVLLIAGACRALAAEEREMLGAYLQRGGRLFALLAPRATSGLEPLYEKWGIRVTPYVAASAKTFSGQDVVASAFADHVITRSLSNASVVFGDAACLECASEDVKENGLDRPKVSLLVSTDRDGWGESRPEVLPRQFDSQSDLRGPVSVVAVSERGGALSKDVAYKPTRLCLVGEADFVMNGALSARANANRDLFLNALSWLAGIDTGTAASLGGDASLATGFTRTEWLAFTAGAVGAIPAAFLLLFYFLSARARR